MNNAQFMKLKEIVSDCPFTEKYNLPHIDESHDPSEDIPKNQNHLPVT